MAGFGEFLGHVVAGAAQGAGQGIVAEAKMLREERMKELDHVRQMESQKREMDFRRTEREAVERFTASENEKTRAASDANRQGDLITMPDGTYGRRIGGRIEPVVGPDGKPVSASAGKGRWMTADEKQAAGVDPKATIWLEPDGTPKAIGGGGTNIRVDTGSIPAGYKANRDENGNIVSIEPIAGSPAAAESDAKEAAERNREEGARGRSGLIAEEIDRALEKMDTGILPDTGVGAWLTGVPNTDAKAIDALLKTIKANIGFAELNKMRQESPTGGALGNVTEKEIEYLQAVAGNLDQSQNAEDLRYNLNRLWNTYMDTIHGVGKGPPRRPLKTGGNEVNRTPGGVEWSID